MLDGMKRLQVAGRQQMGCVSFEPIKLAQSMTSVDKTNVIAGTHCTYRYANMLEETVQHILQTFSNTRNIKSKYVPGKPRQ